MGLARSTFYKDSRSRVDDTALVELIHVIRDESPRYGYQRITTQLRDDQSANREL